MVQGWILENEKTITILIPCFNESEVLPLLYERLRQLPHPEGCRISILFVDDGSTDNTWEQLRSFTVEQSDWNAIRLSRNFGHQRALWVGLENTNSDAVFVIDADLQDPPELIADFAALWLAGADVVYGVRTKRKESLIKRLAYNSFYRILDRVADIKIPLDSGDFCLMDRRVVQAILTSKESLPFIRGLRAWVGFNQQPLSYERDSRAAGKEKYSFLMLLDLAINGLLGYSRKPIRLISFMAGALILLSMLILAGGAFGFMASLLSATTFTILAFAALALVSAGSITGAIGIVGEYVLKIYEGSSERPVAIMSETTMGNLAFERGAKIISIGIDRKAA